MVPFFFHGRKVAALAASDEILSDRLELFPALADFSRFLRRDLVVVRGSGDDRQQIGEFLDDFVGGRNEKRRMRFIRFGIENEEATATLTNPLDEAFVAGATK